MALPNGELESNGTSDNTRILFVYYRLTRFLKTTPATKPRMTLQQVAMRTSTIKPPQRIDSPVKPPDIYSRQGKPNPIVASVKTGSRIIRLYDTKLANQKSNKPMVKPTVKILNLTDTQSLRCHRGHFRIGIRKGKVFMSFLFL